MPAGGFATQHASGRVRSEAARRAILDAAYRLVNEQGYQAVTGKMIAEAAGAGKQTLYRWWPGKAAIVLDAFAEAAETSSNAPFETALRAGDLAGCLRAMLGAARVMGPVLRHLIGEAQFDAALRRRLLERLVQTRRDALMALLEPIAISAIYGAIWYRLLLDEPLEDDLAVQLAALVGKSK